MGALRKKLKKNGLLCYIAGVYEVYRWQLYTAKMWAWIVKFVWTEKSTIYTIILKTSPQNVNDVAENKLKVNKYRWNVTDSDKAIFDLINCGQAHMNYYYFFVRSQSVAQTFSFRQFGLYEIELVSCIILSE